MSNKAEKRGWVPKLRFPEFWEAGEWEKKRIIDTADKKVRWSFIGGPFGSNLKSSDYVVDGIRIIQLQNIGDAEFIDDYRIFTSEEKAEELLSNNIYPGDIILSKMGDPVGRACLIPDVHNRYVMCSDGIRLVVDENANSKYFIYLQINANNFRSLVEKAATGSTRKRIGLDELKNLPVLLPKKCEQQKIADCLASLDELLTLEAQKLDTFKTHKQGLMQQLFPAEGETLPKLRFPEFRDAGAWKEKKAGALFGNRLEDGEDGLPIYSVTMNDGMVKRSSLERRVEDIAESGGNKKVRKSDIAYNMMRMWQGAFGVAPEDCMVSPAYVVLSPESNACPDFFGYLFKLPKYLQFLTSHSQGLTLDRLRLYYKDFARIPVLIPLPLEQQKIADCLASLDDLITAQTQKLAALKTHKKGLMQQIFPALDEVAA